MRYSEAKLGRVFVIRLEHGDVLHESIEQLARERDVRTGAFIIIGGVDEESQLIVGPKEGAASPIEPMVRSLDGVHEVTGTGTLIWDEEADRPTVHAHIAAGRDGTTTTGCVRQGVRVWRTMEVVLIELTGSTAHRVHDAELGFKLLQP